MTPLLLWLHEPPCTDATLVGPKAARLATMFQAGLPVPLAFALTVHAFAAGMTGDVERLLQAAYRKLTSASSSDAVAVRSSAVAEDLEDASFAGMQDTALNVSGEAAMLAAVQHVWASLGSAEAHAYRARAGLDREAMGVLVQRQVEATVAGVAFARDPITHEEAVIVEAVAGLGDVLVSGRAEPQRWRLVSREAQDPEVIQAPAQPLLDESRLTELVKLVEQVSVSWGKPQDVEWAYDGKQLWLLQSRPITSLKEEWFTDNLPGDHYLWTAAFLNERFTQSVSPLGWTLVSAPMERLALKGPLELLGAEQMEGPLLKLWHGYPYSRVEAWQRIYKLFPDALLPEDAARYFPEGDISLRRAPRRPTWGLHLLRNGTRALRENFRALSPLHNPQAWERYEKRQVAMLIRLQFEERQLARLDDPIPAARALLQQAADLTDDLLELHRWSLLYADLTYSLLRRLLILRYGREVGTARAVQLTGNVETITSQMNRALEALAERAVACGARVAEGGVEIGGWRLELEGGRLPGSQDVEVPLPARPFMNELRHFLDRYGHRFFSLDIYDAPWEADVPAFLRFLRTLSPSSTRDRQPVEQVGRPGAPPDPSLILSPLVRLTRAYLKLREAQRFHWQQLLALQRRVVLHMGEWWVVRGKLAVPEDLFGMTWQELMEGEPARELVASRMKQLRQLRAQARQAPSWHHPDFLRGNTPLRTHNRNTELTGRAVSPGIARGPARLIAHPGDFEHIRHGDILVTTSPDPGWTPIFSTVAGLVTERGGQLSHGAVVAREYQLPAVSGIPGAMTQLQEGEMLLVDGTQGVVLRLEAER